MVGADGDRRGSAAAPLALEGAREPLVQPTRTLRLRRPRLGKDPGEQRMGRRRVGAQPAPPSARRDVHARGVLEKRAVELSRASLRQAPRQPRLHPARLGRAGEQDQGRDPEHDADQDRPAPLRDGLRRELDVDRVLPRPAREAGVGVGDEREISGEVRLVADVVAHQPVQAARRLAGEDRD